MRREIIGEIDGRFLRQWPSFHRLITRIFVIILSVSHHESTKLLFRRDSEKFLIDFLFQLRKVSRADFACWCHHVPASMLDRLRRFRASESALSSIKKKSFQPRKAQKFVVSRNRKKEKRKSKRSQFNWNFLGNLFILIHKLEMSPFSGWMEHLFFFMRNLNMKCFDDSTW